MSSFFILGVQFYCTWILCYQLSMLVISYLFQCSYLDFFLSPGVCVANAHFNVLLSCLCYIYRCACLHVATGIFRLGSLSTWMEPLNRNTVVCLTHVRHTGDARIVSLRVTTEAWPLVFTGCQCHSLNNVTSCESEPIKSPKFSPIFIGKSIRVKRFQLLLYLIYKHKVYLTSLFSILHLYIL